MHGWRGLLAGVVGLSVLQLVLSTSQGNGNGAALAGIWSYPAKWLSDLSDPTKPGIPQVASSSTTATKSSSTSASSAVQTSTTAGNGLSNTPTTSGTGSTLLPTQVQQL